VNNIHKAVISVHCHDDLGLAVANSLSAIENGARQVECTVNGIGERAGNASMEEIVMALKTRRDFFQYEVGIVSEQIYPTSASSPISPASWCLRTRPLSGPMPSPMNRAFIRTGS